eukprot:CCRYP_008642-RA/>CCRYP_008642-RA protein AED:0.03 eAED:0.03 QI:354/1/1/1/0/0/2/62/276
MDPICARHVDGISCDESQHDQSDIKLLAELCDSKYKEMEERLYRGKNGFLKKINQNTQQLPQKHHTLRSVPIPIKRMVGRALSLKSRVKKRSLHMSQVGNNDCFGSSLCGLCSFGDGTVTTETTTERSSICDRPSYAPSNNHCLVSSMPWKKADFHSSGLYSGQIDVNSKLPDGFGVFHCLCNDDDCYLKGVWSYGELIQHLDYESDIDDNCDIDEEKHTFSYQHLLCRPIQDVQGIDTCREGDIYLQDLLGAFYCQFSDAHSIHDFYDSDSISVT